jgi:hypothetical protein
LKRKQKKKKEEEENAKPWSKLHMSILMGRHPAFVGQRSGLQEMIESRGHACMFTPKFHPEVAWIELYWAKAKRWTRDRIDRSWAGLKAAIFVALGMPGEEGEGEEESNISSLHRQRFSRKTRDFCRVYGMGATVGTVDRLRKLLKECRRRITMHKQHRSASTAGVYD